MRTQLTLHPDSVCEAVRGIEVEVGRDRGRLLLRYLAIGTTADLTLRSAAPDRTDNLWQSTCFEAFIRRYGEAAYREFNFAPSTQWAAYRFDDYRAGMENADVAAPGITTSSTSKCFELRTSFAVPATPLRLALSAVIEETSGRKSYWALAHPPGKADFHHPDSFVLELPAIS